MAKCASDSPCVSSAKKRKYSAKYQPELATQMDYICASDNEAMFTYCKVCKMHVNVSFGGKYDVVGHSKSASHGTLKNATKTQMKSFFVTSKTTDLSSNVLTAEHNLPFSVAGHFMKLAKQLFPDSDIAGKFTSGCMKTAMIIKKAVSSRLDAKLVQLCQNHKLYCLAELCH